MPKYRVTVLAPFDVVGIIATIGREAAQFKFRLDAYSDSRDIVALFHRHWASSDAFLIGGPLAYNYLMEKMAGTPALTSVSVGYIHYDETAIFRALFDMARVRPHIEIESMRISIDHPAGEHIRECVEEINLGVANTFAKECVSADDVADLVSFHVGLWKQQKITAALTSVHFVYEQLRELSVPVHRIHPSKSAIRTALISLEKRLQEKRAQDQQIAMFTIKFTKAERLGTSDDARRILDRRRLSIEKRLHDIARRFSGVMQWATPTEANILTTRRHVEFQAFSEETARFLSSLQHDFGVGIAAVIGIADAANEARALARNILTQKDFNLSKGIFVVDIDGVVLHGLESDASVRYENRSNDPELVEKAQQAKIGIGTINRVLAFSGGQHSGQFSAQQLAEWMNVTPRSARRIIYRLEKVGLLERSGSQQSFGKGRPTRLFRQASE